MAEENKVEIKFGADIAELKSGMSAATAAVQESTAAMQANFAGLNSGIGASMQSINTSVKSGFAQIQGAMQKMGSVFMAVTAALAGGAAFKDIIDSTADWKYEALKLARALGTTTEQASILMVAIDDIGITQEQFDAGTKMIIRSLRTNEQAFIDLGIKTRDAQGHYRNMSDVMLDVNARLASIKEGTDRNIAGQQVYGRAWLEVQKIVKLNAETMAEAEKRAKELGLTVGPEAAAEVEEYKRQMRDVHDVFLAVKMQIGNALLPVLTQLGAWFNSIGPTAVLAFKVAVAEVTTLIYGLGFAFTFVKEMGTFVIAKVISMLGALGQVAWKVLSGEFKGAWQAAKDGAEDFKIAGAESIDNIAKAAEKTQEKLKKLWLETIGLSAPKQSKAETPTGGAYDGTPKEIKSRVPDWKSELEAQKEAEGAYFKDSLDMDTAFWQTKLAQVKKGSKEEQEVKHELYALHRSQAQQQLGEDIAGLKLQQELAQKGGNEKLAIEEQIVQRIKAAYGEDSKEYKAALREKEKVFQQYNQEQIKLIETRLDREKQLSLISVNMEEENIKLRKSLGRISAVEEAVLAKEIEEKKYDIERGALESRLALQQEDLAAQEKTLAEIEVLDANHALKLKQLNNQKTLAIKSDWDSIFSAVTSAFETSIQGIILGTTTLKQAMSKIGQSILAEFVGLGVKTAAAWVSTELTKTEATAAGAASRLAIESWAAIKKAAIWIGSALKEILVDAYTAAAGAYAAVVGIPIVGPVLAPVAAGTAFATVSGFGASIASAAGGWEVPSDQIAFVHKKEMVLRADLADRIRDMTEPAQSGGGNTVNFKVQAMDSRDVKRFFDKHGDKLVDALKGEYRNYKR